MIQKILLFILLIIPFLFYSCGKTDTETAQKPLYELKPGNSVPLFNSENAYQYIEKQVSFGPRNPGSPGHRQGLFYLRNELTKYAGEVILQSFTYPGYNETLELTNIIAKFNPDAKNRIMLSAHWDTRPRAEEAEDTSKQKLPIPGANDGGSGVGVLLEIARLLKENNLSYGVDIVLFDGEDYGYRNDLSNFCIGSKYFAANLNNYKPVFGILLDMVGDKEAFFPREGQSRKYAPDIVNMIWNLASQSGADLFVNREAGEIYDDHVPLNQAGIRTIDIIDLELIGADTSNKRRNYWHTDKDNMENISAETLQQVGNVLTKLIYSLHFN
ncbi:MAG: M28 family peptidase [Ignavibacteriaceae bacterium]